MATLKVAKHFMEAITLQITSRPILSDEKYSMVVKAQKLAIEAPDHQWAFAGAPADTRSLCQLPGRSCLKINWQT